MQLSKADEDTLHATVDACFSWIAPNADAPKIGLAVSGGGDSIAMLHLFAPLAAARSAQLFVATVNHGLRKEASDEARFVAEVCAEYHLPHEVLSWDDWDGSGNVQSEARAARYRLLSEWSTANSLDVVALGHTCDDVAETFLMRLARGSGLDGLAAMERHFERYGATFARPLLGLRRETLRLFLASHGYRWCEDPSNEDARFQRVKTRSVLKELASLGVDSEEIARAAGELQSVKSLIRRYTKETAEKIVEFQGGDLVVAQAAWRAVPREMQRRLLNAMLQWVGGTDYPPRAEAVAELQAQLLANSTHSLNGCLVTQSAETLRVVREHKAVESLVGEFGDVWDGRWMLDGPSGPDLQLRALGERGLKRCPDWRETGLPYRSLLASPALWRGDELVAAPLAGRADGWCARLTRSREQFLSWLFSH
ncbi:MAG: tRNA lysidine(34) synthetase TilS [Litoreibacter sp.]|nr:tRNA lysidine(34) synthetase TilS [Litoreibacter sp.]MCY4336517.1 tRNA lysidine(34) synthetase TilS [Litoreibacter sp.]